MEDEHKPTMAYRAGQALFWTLITLGIAVGIVGVAAAGWWAA